MATVIRTFVKANEKNSTNMTRQIDCLSCILAEKAPGAHSYGRNWLVEQEPRSGFNYPYTSQKNRLAYGNVHMLSRTGYLPRDL